MPMNELEQAWREGYTAGYGRGVSDTSRYEWGCGSNKLTKRDEDNEWEASDTKTATTNKPEEPK